MSFCERPQLTCAILNPLWDTFTSIRNQLPSQDTIVQLATENLGGTAVVATVALVAIPAIALCCQKSRKKPQVLESEQNVKEIMSKQESLASSGKVPNLEDELSYGKDGRVLFYDLSGKHGKLQDILASYTHLTNPNNPALDGRMVLVYRGSDQFQFATIANNRTSPMENHILLSYDNNGKIKSDMPIQDVFLIKQAPAEGKHAGK